MPVTTIDPKAALIVIDLQSGIVAQPTAQPAEHVIKNAAVLADAFRDRQLPVVLVNVAGVAPGRAERPIGGGKPPAGWSDLVPELGRRPSDHTITKFRWNAFHETGLYEYLIGAGTTQIVLAGIATSLGVESTARTAHERGFNVTVAIDAVTDMNPEAHANSVSQIFPRLGETGTTEAIVAALDTSPMGSDG
jgi:nicotinamidase-related amidase